MKITILGFSGAGKSTLAAALGRRYGLPVLHLDRVHFAPGWAERTQPAQQADVAAFLDANSETGWVIDGNYTNLCYDRRLAESDRILILAFGRWACLRRVMETDEPFTAFEENCVGLDLPEKTLRDIYFNNYHKFIRRMDKKIDVDMVLEYADTLYDRIPAGENHQLISDTIDYLKAEIAKFR